MNESPSPTERILSLEALRGLAAIVVAIGHFCIGFLPIRHGGPAHAGDLPAALQSEGWVGSPFFLIANSSGAVCVFFALSGFVLTLKHIQEPRALAIFDSLLRRYLRLVIPIAATVFLSGALFWANAYHFESAGELTQSKWLRTFGHAYFAPSYDPPLRLMLEHIVYGVPFLGWYQMNSVLWTMQIEFFGSLFVLGSCYLLFLPTGRLGVALWLAAAAVLSLHYQPQYLPFSAGMALALLPAPRALGRSAQAALVVPALLCFSYYKPVGVYAPLEAFDWTHGAAGRFSIWTLGSLLMIQALRAPRPAGSLLAGSIAAWLGRISFPLYLTHALVISSLCAWIHVSWDGAIPDGARLALNATAFVLVSALATLAFIPVDRASVVVSRAFSHGLLRLLRLRAATRSSDTR